MEGDIVVPDDILRNSVVLIDTFGIIKCVGDDCRNDSNYAGATKVVCQKALVTPGLINGHDHITFTGHAPKDHGTARYDHRHEWRKGAGPDKPKIPVGQTYGAAAWGELRNIVAGATSMFGSGNAKGLLRNLDVAMIGLPDALKSKYDTFPLGDGKDGVMLTDSCAYPNMPDPTTTAGFHCWVPHLAEGVNQAARNEFLCLSGAAPGGKDNILENTAFIHGVALTATDIAHMAQVGSALIWSPRTNVDLYGNTAAITLYSRLGVTIGLGSDWTASGSVNMMRELACADELNKAHFDNFFTDRELFDMATIGTARAFQIESVVGSLEVDKVADIAIFHNVVHKDFRAVIDGNPSDVALVLRGGTVLYGDAHLVPGLPGGSTGCEALDVCEVAKSVCTIRETEKTLAELRVASVQYDLFFCGIPDNEPSCLPFRPGEYDGIPKEGDMDGDGIPDDQDNCPTIFNPIRPMDNGKQADEDNDGVGDVCDPCPLDANTDVCTHFDPNDRDGDGFPNELDNCPSVYNPDQIDSDGDGKGDACDPCPHYYNPGNAYCPHSIYDIKKGVVPAGAVAEVREAVVTAHGFKNGVFQGFFIQVDQDDAERFEGSEYSGLYCFGPSINPRPAVGAVVTVDGLIDSYYNQIQLKVRNLTVVDNSEVIPVPVDVTAADVATGGTQAAAYESVLIKVSDVVVTNQDPDPGAGDARPHNEFEVTGGLRVNDFVYKLDPLPLTGDEFALIAGILRWANGLSKLEPRSEADAIRRNVAAKLASFGPDTVYIQKGSQAVPKPDLVVKLQRPVDSDTFVAVTSSAPDSATIVGGGVQIPAGQMVGLVTVDALEIGSGITLTASLDTVSLNATLNVVAQDATPVASKVEPDPMELTEGDQASATLYLDMPVFGAPASFAVAANPTGIVEIPATVEVQTFALSALIPVTAIAKGSTTVTVSSANGSVNFQVNVAEAPEFPRVFISEYVEGSSYNKAIEVFNNTGADLSLASCELRLYSNGSATSTASVRLGEDNETIPHGGTFVVCHKSANEAILSICNLQNSSVCNFNGDDALDLVCDDIVVDTFGQIGFQPNKEWIGSQGKARTADRTLRRKCGIGQGQPDGSGPFDPDLEWDNYAKDTFSGLGSHQVTCD